MAIAGLQPDDDDDEEEIVPRLQHASSSLAVARQTP